MVLLRSQDYDDFMQGKRIELSYIAFKEALSRAGSVYSLNDVLPYPMREVSLRFNIKAGSAFMTSPTHFAKFKRKDERCEIVTIYKV